MKKIFCYYFGGKSLLLTVHTYDIFFENWYKNQIDNPILSMMRWSLLGCHTVATQTYTYDTFIMFMYFKTTIM